MPVSHYLKIFNTAGTSPIIVTQSPSGNDPTKGPFTNLVYSNVLNGYGILKFTLNGNHAAIVNLTPFALVEVWRSWPEKGIAAYRDWSGLFLDEDSSLDSSSGDLFSATCYGDQYFLSMRSVAWDAGLDLRASFTADKAETIMKTLADYNAGPNALAANGRDEDGSTTGITIEADGAHGNTVDWNCANSNLLNTLQSLAPGAGGDFDLVKTGAQAWQFRWYIGQRGTDRTASVKFSLELGNMTRPRYSYIRAGERTVALVKGAGVGVDRVVAIRTGANYSASNKAEMYVNASSQTTTAAGLNSTGDAALKASQAQEAISFDALPASNSVYGKDWFLGDKLTVKYKAHALTPRVVAVTISLDQNQNEIVAPVMAVNV